MARKKIVFVIVEGLSDETALGAILSRIYDNETVYVHIMHGDITTEQGVSPINIFSRIGDAIRGYASSNHFRKDDFKEIVHIVDMDGAFVPDECIIEDEAAAKPLYSLTDIRTSNKRGIQHRNQIKRANIDKLCTCKVAWKVPYRIFYMSCNLDHVLYNKLNSTDEDKETDSFQFARKYKNCIPEFLSFISESEFSVTDGYKESWEYIKQELHSLERHTNLGLCFGSADDELINGNE
ncbi:MAG: hypothetical protein Q4B70_14350 [Lachnospiraceae bacterium]|nr:hypothetical protein [Lachnospiraceae bacterium]